MAFKWGQMFRVKGAEKNQKFWGSRTLTEKAAAVNPIAQTRNTYQGGWAVCRTRWELETTSHSGRPWTVLSYSPIASPAGDQVGGKGLDSSKAGVLSAGCYRWRGGKEMKNIIKNVSEGIDISQKLTVIRRKWRQEVVDRHGERCREPSPWGRKGICSFGELREKDGR